MRAFLSIKIDCRNFLGTVLEIGRYWMKRLYNKIKKQHPKQQWSVIPCEEEKRAENDGESGALALYFATPYLIRFLFGDPARF